MKYELWKSESENSYAFFAAGHKANAGPLPDDARLIWTVEAKTWEEASILRNEFLGWEPYKPAGESAPCPKCGAPFYPQGSGECPNCGRIC